MARECPNNTGQFTDVDTARTDFPSECFELILFCLSVIDARNILPKITIFGMVTHFGKENPWQFMEVQKFAGVKRREVWFVIVIKHCLHMAEQTGY